MARAAEHTMLHATIASFEYRARRQTVSRGCYRILASKLLFLRENGRVDGWRERGGEYPREKDRLLTEPGLESSAILCSCCTRHTRLTGTEEYDTVRGWVVQR